MKLIWAPGMRRPFLAAEWKDAKHIVKRILKEERVFLRRMADK